MTDATNTLASPSRVGGLVNRENLHEPATQQMLRRLAVEEREAVALASGTMTQYFGDEVAAARAAEETAALRAMPPGHPLEQLNGLTVGAGLRSMHAGLLGVDPQRSTSALGGRRPRSSGTRSHVRGWAGSLPFRPESIDFIVAVHVLEHEPDPVAIVRHWLDVLKPGGGVGIVVPDWRYTRNARGDRHPWGHRWNPTPALLRSLHARHWAHAATLEHIDTYRFKLSFDVVLRKHGTFVPFDERAFDNRPTGHDLYCRGAFLGEEAA